VELALKQPRRKRTLLEQVTWPGYCPNIDQIEFQESASSCFLMTHKRRRLATIARSLGGLKPSSSLRSLSFSTLKLMRSTCSNLRPHSDTNNWSDRIPSSHSPWIADESKNEQKLLPFIYQWEFWILNFCRFPFIVFISVVFFFWFIATSRFHSWWHLTSFQGFLEPGGENSYLGNKVSYGIKEVRAKSANKLQSLL